MTEPLISIIVPVYKTEKYLPQCIESILAQTYKNLEIILIDDGSPDNSSAICDKYAAQDNRIVVIHKENGGVSSARNAGLKIAKGEYIGFVDSDDYIAPDMYEYLYGLMVREHVNVSMCNFREEINHKWNTFPQITQVEEKISITQLFNLRLWTYLMNKLFKRTILQDVYFDERLSFGEDACLLFHALKKADSCVVSNKDKYYYRDNLMGYTHNFKKSHLYYFQTSQQFLEFASEHNLPIFYNSVYQTRLLCMSAWIGWIALEENADKESVQILQSYCRENLWELLKYKKIKVKKKLFLLLACINFHLASYCAKKFIKKEMEND